MRKIGAIVFLALMLVGFSDSIAQVDTDATSKTRILYSNLKKIQNSNQFLFGQEFFNSFRFNSGSAHGDEDYSDSKAVTGSHPALLGSDFHYYLEKNATERGYHTDAVKWAYQQGCVVTFDWHISARGTTSYESGTAPPNLVNNIVANLNGDRDWFFGELDKVIKIINEDLVVGGDTIPIVFRPFHEMNGGWFWWGSNSTTAANYKLLYALMADYVKARTRSVLFCWSPNTPVNMNYYPGDQYVDVLGVDAYEVTANSLRTDLATIVDYSLGHGKVAVLSETGNRTPNGDNAANYWKNTVLPAIMDDPAGKAKKIAWVLTWINSSWSYPYVPHSTSSTAAKQSFNDFKNSTNVLFANEIEDMYSPLPDVTVSVEESLEADGVKIFPVPTNNAITISLENFKNPSIRLFDSKGTLTYEATPRQNQITILLKEFAGPGIYLIRINDQQKTVTRKILVY